MPKDTYQQLKFKEIIELLNDPITKSFVEDENLDAVYGRNSVNNTPLLTEYLESIGVDPLDYVTRIIPYMYEGCPHKKLVIPETVTKISHYAFGGDTLEYVEILNDNCDVSPYAFNHLDDWVKIYFQGVTKRVDGKFICQGKWKK